MKGEFPTMTDEEIIRMMREHFEGLFPKVCNSCGRHYETLREYILDTKRLGGGISYEAEAADWETTEPLGGVALANCPCGTTLALTTEGILISKIHLVLKWIRVESERQGVSPMELLSYLRDEVRKRVLSDHVQGQT
jgi:hypothetical protein